MKKIFMLLLLTTAFSYGGTKLDKVSFIKDVPDSVMFYAQKIDKEYGIPYEATLAISIIETGWWSSNLYKRHNNLFGISPNGKSGKKFKSIYDCIMYYAKLISTKSYYKDAYANRQDINKFVDNLIYWNPGRQAYTKSLKYFINRYDFFNYDNKFICLKTKEVKMSGINLSTNASTGFEVIRAKENDTTRSIELVSTIDVDDKEVLGKELVVKVSYKAIIEQVKQGKSISKAANDCIDMCKPAAIEEFVKSLENAGNTKK